MPRKRWRSPRERRPVGALLLLLPLVMLAWACPASEPSAPSGGPAPRAAAPVQAVTPAPRIAVMAPAAMEMLDVLGMLDRVVGVGDFVQWPPAARELPRLGPYHAPNVERVLELRTDLLITAYSEAGRASLRHLEELGIGTLALRTDTYEGMLSAFLALGQALDAEEAARAAVQRIRARMDAVRARTAGAPRRRVLVVVGREPLYVAGPGSHIDELITAAGGENVAADATAPYQLMSLEPMLERKPEVIIEIAPNRPAGGRDPGAWGKWPFLPAVARNRVFWVDPARLSIPGPRLPDMAETMGRLIHPEIFGEPTAAELGPLGEGEAAAKDGNQP